MQLVYVVVCGGNEPWDGARWIAGVFASRAVAEARAAEVIRQSKAQEECTVWFNGKREALIEQKSRRMSRAQAMEEAYKETEGDRAILWKHRVCAWTDVVAVPLGVGGEWDMSYPVAVASAA